MLNDFSNIEFVNPWLLLLLFLIPVLGYFLERRKAGRHSFFRFSDLKALEKEKSRRGRIRVILPVLRLVALAALVVALARPQKVFKKENIKGDGIDIMLVMDLSSSMLARDFKPDRLEVSKKVASTFVDKRKYDRIGLAVFSGEAYTQCPLTTDHSVVKRFLDRLECGNLEDGTAIGMGLATSINRLKDKETKSKVVILLTDGVNNAGYIKPLTAAQIARELGVKVYTIGVGTTGDAFTPISRRSDGQYVFGLASVEIDEALLREISEMTGGKYFRAISEESLERIYEEIDKLEKTEIEVSVIKRQAEAFHPWVFIALVLLGLEFFLKHTYLNTVP